jgi:Flp pilus assembly CpaF family ATPase
VITCEDAAELQLQQPHVVRLETRPPNLEGSGSITMRDLVKNCLRMRPERIIVGEVRGPEAFDLLQAMNTGHDGSMGTLHANSPREALSRLESMITMGGFGLKDIEARGKRKRQSLRARNAQSGLSWSRNKYITASLASAAFSGFAAVV